MPRPKVCEKVRKSERLGLALTADQREAVAKVAEASGFKDHSLILHEKSVKQCVREYKRLQALFSTAA